MPSLMTLPQELRDMIWSLALNHEGPLYLTSYTTSSSAASHFTALLHTSHQVRRECIPIFYGLNLFRIEQTWPAPINPSVWTLWRHLSDRQRCLMFSFQLDSLLHIRAITFDWGYNHIRQGVTPVEILLWIRHCMPRVQRLVLRIFVKSLAKLKLFDQDQGLKLLSTFLRHFDAEFNIVRSFSNLRFLDLTGCRHDQSMNWRKRLGLLVTMCEFDRKNCGVMEKYVSKVRKAVTGALKWKVELELVGSPLEITLERRWLFEFGDRRRRGEGRSFASSRAGWKFEDFFLEAGEKEEDAIEWYQKSS